MISGTESNHGIKFIPRLARFNPRLALIGFPGTLACEQQTHFRSSLLSRPEMRLLFAGYGNPDQVYKRLSLGTAKVTAVIVVVLE